jgi:hypothetical protein
MVLSSIEPDRFVHQPLRLMHPIEGGVSPRREGATASFALVAALFSAMDHYVSLARTTVGATASVVTPLSVRVHEDTLLFGGQRPNKDGAGPARTRSPTLLPSTLQWGATRWIGAERISVFGDASGSGGCILMCARR